MHQPPLTSSGPAQMALDDLHPAVWSSLHADLGRFVATDECLQSVCCDVVAGTRNFEIFEVLNVNQTDWCETSLNMTLCYNASGAGCLLGWDVSNSNGIIACICLVWLIALATTLHARRWGAGVLEESKCCNCFSIRTDRVKQANATAQPMLPAHQASNEQRESTRPSRAAKLRPSVRAFERKGSAKGDALTDAVTELRLERAAEIFKRELRVTGSNPIEVLDAACVECGVSEALATAGLTDLERAARCFKALGLKKDANDVLGLPEKVRLPDHI